jgi:hypothetical protein
MDKKKKKPTINEMVDKAENIGEVIKDFAPAEVDNLVDRGIQGGKMIKPGMEMAKTIWKSFRGGIFSRKSRLF